MRTPQAPTDDMAAKRAELAALDYVPRRLAKTLADVLEALRQHSDALPEDEFVAIQRMRRALAREVERINGLTLETLTPDALPGVETLPTTQQELETAKDAALADAIEDFLQRLEELDGVIRVAYDALKAGKQTRVVRSGRSLSSNDVAEALDALTTAPTPQAELLPGEGGEAELHTQVDFPAQIFYRDENIHPLTVRLVQEAPAESRADAGVVVDFLDAQTPELVEVHLSAPGFSETTGVWTRTLVVYQGQDTEPAVFLLRLHSQTAGQRLLHLDFYHLGQPVGSAHFQVEITGMLSGRSGPTRSGPRPRTTPGRLRTRPPGPEPDAPAGAAQVSGVQGVQLLADAARDTDPPDAILRIVRSDDGKALHYTLASPLGRLGYRSKPVGVTRVPTLKDPVLLLSGLFQELDHLARQPVDGLTEEEGRAGLRTIQSLGNNLYADLFPDELKAEYWRLVALRNAGKINSLLILSDEPWIPWEMVLPYEDDQPEEDFLCMGWRFSRWCASRGLTPQLQVRAAQLVAPALDLEYVQAERRYFEELARHNLTVRPPITRRGAFLELLESGGVQLCHIASHGRFDATDVDRSPIIMEDDELLPTDLAPVHTKGLRQERPLIFLNACHGGRVDFTLTGIGGWAQRVVDHLAATAFIGAYWEVHDELAAGFAAAFYDELGRGALLGDALRAARRVTRARQPANPTWLAYTLYGHPNARVEVGR